uniref:Ribonuclease A-domain domain-containing protein n=1 Tax=Amphilophus citrinellus TaxID=61819 RepID=A0A3Q0RJW9_AMPCI
FHVKLLISYKDFKKKHLLPVKGPQKCYDMMKNINKKSECREIHTFIKDQEASVKVLCKGKKEEVITPELNVIDCVRSNETPCAYNDTPQTVQKKIKCKKGLPVYLEKTVDVGIK